MFRSLTLLKDHNQKKGNMYIGLTETHLLFFKESSSDKHINVGIQRHHHSLMVKNEKSILEPESTVYRLTLISYAEMQCIDTILYN